MRSGGQNRKPTAIKLLEGNPGKRPLPEREPTPTVGTPRPPKWLRKEARGYWRAAVKSLQDMGVLTMVDGPALARLAEAEAACVDAQRNHPEDWKRIMELAKFHAQLMQQFGLTPASRGRVKTEKPKPAEQTQDQWSRLLS
jgi:phage terminase small subunit